VVRALEARDPGVDHGLVLTGVEVAPRPVLMVVDRRALQALGTDPPGLRREKHPYMNLPLIELEIDPIHSPRLLNPQDLLVQRSVVHPASSLVDAPKEATTGPSLSKAFQISHTKPG
jgi:hypothetical protein